MKVMFPIWVNVAAPTKKIWPQNSAKFYSWLKDDNFVSLAGVIDLFTYVQDLKAQFYASSAASRFFL